MLRFKLITLKNKRLSTHTIYFSLPWLEQRPHTYVETTKQANAFISYNKDKCIVIQRPIFQLKTLLSIFSYIVKVTLAQT